MLRREGWDALEADVHVFLADGVADGEDAGIEDADDVTGVGLVDDGAVLGHELLGLGKPEGLARLDMEILFIPLKAARADAHEGDAVAVGLVHVGLDFEDEGGEALVHGIDDIVLGNARQGRHGHFQEGLQKRLHAEVIEG